MIIYENERKLDYIHIRIAEILLDRIHSGREDKSVITYDELSRELDREVGNRQLSGYLGDLSDICKELDLPLISSMVINVNENRPGAGYYKYFFPKAKKNEFTDIFIRELHAIKEAEENGEWELLEDELNLLY